MSARRAPGSGSVFPKRAKNGVETWYGKWSTGGVQIKRALGPKRRSGSRDGLTRSHAEARLRELQAEVRPRAPAGERLDIAELGRRYVVHLERKGRKRSTVVAVKSCLAIWLEPRFAGRALDRIGPKDVDDLIAAMEDKGLSPKSIANYIGTLSALFRFATGPRRRWASSNPCDGAELPEKAHDDRIRFLTPDEVDRLVANAKSGAYHELDRVLYRTAAMTGLRQGELIALRWGDVDFPASSIRVVRNHVLGEFDTPKSELSGRSVPLADEAAGELDRYCKARGEPAADELVFGDPHRAGEPLHKAAILRRLRIALQAAGLPAERTFHDLRHTFGTQMAAAGVPLRTLQEWMGHADLATTQRYSHYAPKARDAELVAAAFRRESGATLDPGLEVAA